MGKEGVTRGLRRLLRLPRRQVLGLLVPHRRGRPLHKLGWLRSYVCPRSGLLRRVQAPRKHRKGWTRRRDTPSYIGVGDTLVCKLIGGAWHLVTVQPLPPPGRATGSR